MIEAENDSYQVALTSRTRRRVLDALAAAASPWDAQQLAEQLELHVTTVRFHLEQLERARLVRRQTSTSNGRGRPRILYSLAGQMRDDDTREQLIGVLAEALSDRGDVGRSRSVRAGRRWAESLESPGGDAPTAMTEMLERLGFDPELERDSIALHACPFRDAAREHPDIVCSVHRGLVESVLRKSDQARELTVELTPFVEPELCLVTFSSHATPPVTSAG